MDVTLHLGAHRTATTTFQRFLSANRPRLLREGVGVWVPRETRSGMVSGLVRRPETVTLADERIGRRAIGALRVRQERLASSGVQRLIVSEQNLIGTARTCLARQRLYPWPSERLERFVPAFEDRCDRIVLTVRSYDRFWASLLGQAVMAGHPMPESDLLDRLVTQPLRWRRLVEEVASSFPEAELLVVPFERLGGLPERLLAAMIGTPLPAGYASRMHGTRDWYARSPGSAQLREVLSDRCEAPVRTLPVDATGRWQPFNDDQCAALAAQYAEDLAWLRSGASGHATLIASADAEELRTVGRTEGRQADDKQATAREMG